MAEEQKLWIAAISARNTTAPRPVTMPITTASKHKVNRPIERARIEMIGPKSGIG